MRRHPAVVGGAPDVEVDTMTQPTPVTEEGEVIGLPPTPPPPDTEMEPADLPPPAPVIVVPPSLMVDDEE